MVLYFFLQCPAHFRYINLISKKVTYVVARVPLLVVLVVRRLGSGVKGLVFTLRPAVGGLTLRGGVFFMI